MLGILSGLTREQLEDLRLTTVFHGGCTEEECLGGVPVSPSRNIDIDLCENVSEPDSTMDQDQDDLLLDASDSDIIVPLGGGHQCDPHPAPCVPMIGETLFGLSQSPSEYSFRKVSVLQPHP